MGRAAVLVTHLERGGLRWDKLSWMAVTLLDVFRKHGVVGQISLPEVGLVVVLSGGLHLLLDKVVVDGVGEVRSAPEGRGKERHGDKRHGREELEWSDRHCSNRLLDEEGTPGTATPKRAVRPFYINFPLRQVACPFVWPHSKFT